MYARPHNSEHSVFHQTRIEATILAVKALCLAHEPAKFADLSCGDAKIARAVSHLCDGQYLGDLAPGYQYHGAIEHTVGYVDVVDVFVLSETIEHVADPQWLLDELATVTHNLVLTTPLDEQAEARNPEHVWSFTGQDINDMLYQAGFSIREGSVLHLKQYGCEYDFQIWIASV